MPKSTKLEIDAYNKISSDRLEFIIEKNVTSILKNPALAHSIPPVMCWGSPGLGKSSIVKGVAEKLGIDFIDVRLPQMEPCDIRGLPVPDEKTKTMNWYVNSSWPTNPSGKGIIFLDELSACDKSIAVAAYELILDRRLGTLYNVPDGYYIVAAGNLTTDRAVSLTMPSALANRFMHVELDVDAKTWINWAQGHDIHPSVTGYIAYRPECLFNMKGENLERGWPSPRSWERVSEMMKIYSDVADDDILRTVVYSLVGPAKGVEFIEFHRLNKNFDNVIDMMYGRIPIKIPTKNDEQYALASSLIYNVWKASNDDDQVKRLDGFLKITTEMPPEFGTMCILGAITAIDPKNRGKAATMMYKNENFIEWSKKHHDALKKGLVI